MAVSIKSCAAVSVVALVIDTPCCGTSRPNIATGVPISGGTSPLNRRVIPKGRLASAAPARVVGVLTRQELPSASMDAAGEALDEIAIEEQRHQHDRDGREMGQGAERAPG